MTGKPDWMEILNDHRMFSLEKKRVWDFDGCFLAFRELLCDYRRSLKPFGGYFGSSNGVTVRKGWIHFDVFMFSCQL